MFANHMYAGEDVLRVFLGIVAVLVLLVIGLIWWGLSQSKRPRRKDPPEWEEGDRPWRRKENREEEP